MSSSSSSSGGEESVPEYNEWFKLVIRVKKPANMEIKEFISKIRQDFEDDFGFEYKEMMVEAMETVYGHARPDMADKQPAGMWVRVYKETPKGTIFDILGNIDLAQEVDLTAEAKQQSD